MGSLVQSTVPVIKFHSCLDKANCYQIFSPNSRFASGTNLQSYSFSRSVNNLEGQFQITIKEDFDSAKMFYEETFYDKVENLDVVEFFENDVLQFVGVVTDRSFSATANGLQKTISISGKSIEYLFSYLNISFNVTAMAYTKENLNKPIANLQSKWNLGQGGDPISVKKMITETFNEYSKVAESLSKLSNTLILNMISVWYGIDPFYVQSGLFFNYPISSNLFTDDVCDFISYVRNLLPQNIYEIFGIIKNGEPKICIREVPFDGEVLVKIPNRFAMHTYTKKGTNYYQGGAWSELRSTIIYPEILTDYTITRSINEVYTAFYSYIEGSQFDQSFYENLQSIKSDDTNSGSYAFLNTEKISKYGYKPLRVNFCGFNLPVANEESVKNELNEMLKELNERIGNWYGKLDEMYDATVSCLVVNKYKTANVGEKLIFMNGEFYVTGIEHSWTYGYSAKVTYHCERGGAYDLLGNFKSLKNITRKIGELK